ncbi:MAG: hypothetical protein EBS07_07070 [Sphingobacteriia bacterium]|nr:hypothetical protein [Sphingobacteriia bacterium]
MFKILQVRHGIWFSGLLVLLAFFSRISRTALNDGFFSKLSENAARNSVPSSFKPGTCWESANPEALQVVSIDGGDLEVFESPQNLFVNYSIPLSIQLFVRASRDLRRLIFMSSDGFGMAP